MTWLKPASVFDGTLSADRGWLKRSAAERQIVLANILAEVSSEALQGESLEAVLKRIVDCVINRLPVTVASIILLNEANTHFVEEVFSGHIDLTLPSDLPWPIDLGVAGRCVRTGESQLIADVMKDPDYVPGNSAVRSEYLVPIKHRGRLHGVLNLESTSKNFFSIKVRAAFDAIAIQIAGAVHLAMVVRELEVANRKLQLLSMSDGLTGIANRRCFDRELAEAWAGHRQQGTSLGLLLVDVDCFKLLNDARGHQHGDECLRTLAQCCAAQFPDEGDLVARFGGEEFAVLLPGHGLAEARKRAENLRRSIEALALEHPASAVAAYVTVSIGVSAARPVSTAGCDSLVAAADRALYAAKNKRRNCVVARATPKG